MLLNSGRFVRHRVRVMFRLGGGGYAGIQLIKACGHIAVNPVIKILKTNNKLVPTMVMPLVDRFEELSFTR